MKKEMKVLGAGVYNFDTIIKREYPDGFVPGKRNRFEEMVLQEELGGTTGNVMCLLSYLGWDSYPIALFDDYPQGLQCKKDFERYGCNTHFVSNTPQGGTSCITITHGLDKDGSYKKGVSKRHAPFSGFPGDKSLSVREGVPQFMDQLDFVPDVYFFETITAGWRDIAERLKEKGTFIYYELGRMNPNDIRKYRRCMELSHVVKCSDEEVIDDSILDGLDHQLVVQTLGKKGIRYRLCGGGWVVLPPVPEKGTVVDTEGCGDWTTAGLIHALGKRGLLDISKLTDELVKDCLMEAQGYAARNVEYFGTKGIIAADKAFGLAPSGYRDPYRDLMQSDGGIGKTKHKTLASIPEKDYREYDEKESFVYGSSMEKLRGVVTPVGENGSVMSNFYPCELPYVWKDEKVVFHSAEQAYHFFRYADFPIIQQVVLKQRRAVDVMTACRDFKRVSADHEETRWKYMTLVEELKYLYCDEFRQKVRSLQGLYLVESSDSNDVFGSTIPGDDPKVARFKGTPMPGYYVGMNGCGRCIMAVAEKFKDFSDQQLADYASKMEYDLNKWWGDSPVYQEQLNGMGK